MKNLLMLLLAAMSTGAMAEWVRVGSNIDTTMYADLSTIRRSGDTAKLWSLDDYKSPESVKGIPPYLSRKSQTEFDCKEERSRTLYFSVHSENMSAGNSIYAGEGFMKWRPVSPGSADEILWEVACGKTTLN